jgi:hypothetical protein
MVSIYHRIRAFFKRKRRLGLEDIPTLPENVLARIRAEAGLLRDTHHVAVRSLHEGEEASPPRAADPAVEAMLMVQAPAEQAAEDVSAPAP